MAQTRKKRRRKHRGTQAGVVERSPRARSGGGTRPRTPAERRAHRFDREPTWRSAFTRASIASALLAILMIAFLDSPPRQAIPLALFMLLVYVPLGYFSDRFFWTRRQRKKRQPVAERVRAPK
jgi:hypothetical protein